MDRPFCVRAKKAEENLLIFFTCSEADRSCMPVRVVLVVLVVKKFNFGHPSQNKLFTKVV